MKFLVGVESTSVFCLLIISLAIWLNFITVVMTHELMNHWDSSLLGFRSKWSCDLQSVQLLSPVRLFEIHGLQHTRSPVHHPLPESTQTHVHWVGDAIQPSHPLSSPSPPPVFNLSQHHGLFQWVSLSHEVTKVLEFQLQHQSFKWICRTDFLQDGQVGSLWSPRDSQGTSPEPQFKSINSSVLSFLYSPTLISLRDYWKNHKFD